MIKDDWKKYIENERIKYKNIGYVECPAFSNEKLYFNHYGFDHIVYKNGVPRPQEEVIRRFYLLKYVPNILKNTKYIDNEEKRMKCKSTAYFWTIKPKDRWRIILRRLNNGTLHFYSIMD